MIELTNGFVREKLNEYLSTKGVKQTFIATYSGLSNCSISKFLRGDRELSQVYLKKIYDLITK